MCVCGWVCVRVCVRECVHARARVCVRVCVFSCVRMYVLCVHVVVYVRGVGKYLHPTRGQSGVLASRQRSGWAVAPAEMPVQARDSYPTRHP